MIQLYCKGYVKVAGRLDKVSFWKTGSQFASSSMQIGARPGWGRAVRKSTLLGIAGRISLPRLYCHRAVCAQASRFFQAGGQGKALGRNKRPHPLLPAYGAVKAQRKPTTTSRVSGASQWRSAERTRYSSLCHEPPRSTLYCPSTGPVGFEDGELA